MWWSSKLLALFAGIISCEEDKQMLIVRWWLLPKNMNMKKKTRLHYVCKKCRMKIFVYEMKSPSYKEAMLF
jgi:hypothetical protein